jgi:hypothetical protein
MSLRCGCIFAFGCGFGCSGVSKAPTQSTILKDGV